jgi:hypothetical protein
VTNNFLKQQVLMQNHTGEIIGMKTTQFSLSKRIDMPKRKSVIGNPKTSIASGCLNIFKALILQSKPVLLNPFKHDGEKYKENTSLSLYIMNLCAGLLSASMPIEFQGLQVGQVGLLSLSLSKQNSWQPNLKISDAYYFYF